MSQRRDANMTSPPQAPVKVPSRRVVMGPVVEVEEPYAREVGVPPALLFPLLIAALAVDLVGLLVGAVFRIGVPTARRPLRTLDRKSTRLNSSHSQISY